MYNTCKIASRFQQKLDEFGDGKKPSSDRRNVLSDHPFLKMSRNGNCYWRTLPQHGDKFYIAPIGEQLSQRHVLSASRCYESRDSRNNDFIADQVS